MCSSLGPPPPVPLAWEHRGRAAAAAGGPPRVGEITLLATHPGNGLRDRLDREIKRLQTATTGYTDGKLACIAFRDDGGDLRGAAATTLLSQATPADLPARPRRRTDLKEPGNS